MRRLFRSFEPFARIGFGVFVWVADVGIMQAVQRA